MVQVAVDHLRADPAVALGRALHQVFKVVCRQNPAQVICRLAATALRVLVDGFILPQAADDLAGGDELALPVDQQREQLLRLLVLKDHRLAVDHDVQVAEGLHPNVI